MVKESRLSGGRLDQGDFQLFIELPPVAETQDMPDWIPYLPKPGVFRHPRYGTISITPERNQEFIDSFQNKIYQDRLPLDAEHQTKLSGALGWVTVMRLNEDGSADARVDWTERGRSLVSDNRFKYISPEWYDEWEDPATQIRHRNVAIGGALTTKPFFKEGSLRPLIASENGYSTFEESETGEISGNRGLMVNETVNETLDFDETEDPVVMSEQQVVEVQMSEEVSRQFTELHNALEEARLERDDARRMSEQLEERVESISRASRRMQFTAMVEGDEDDPESPRWLGDHEVAVSLLERIADTFGEESDTLGEFIEQQRSIAEQARTSQLFAERGSDARPSSTTPLTQRIAAQVAELRAMDPGLTMSEAQSQVFAENPQWYTEYRKSASVRI